MVQFEFLIQFGVFPPSFFMHSPLNCSLLKLPILITTVACRWALSSAGALVARNECRRVEVSLKAWHLLLLILTGLRQEIGGVWLETQIWRCSHLVTASTGRSASELQVAVRWWRLGARRVVAGASFVERLLLKVVVAALGRQF